MPATHRCILPPRTATSAAWSCCSPLERTSRAHVPAWHLSAAAQLPARAQRLRGSATQGPRAARSGECKRPDAALHRVRSRQPRGRAPAPAAGANPDVRSSNLPGVDTPSSPLFIACQSGHTRLRARDPEPLALVADRPNRHGITPILIACFAGHLDCVKLLSLNGALRRQRAADTGRQHDCETLAEDNGHQAVRDWLVRSRGWHALHHIDALTAARRRDSFCAPARTRTRGHQRSPTHSEEDPRTPLELARELLDSDPGHTVAAVARMVVAAGGEWTPETHELFPAAARAQAQAVLRPLYQLANSPKLAEGGPPPFWLAHAVIRHLIKPKYKTNVLLGTVLAMDGKSTPSTAGGGTDGPRARREEHDPHAVIMFPTYIRSRPAVSSNE